MQGAPSVNQRSIYKGETTKKGTIKKNNLRGTIKEEQLK